jgi:membrane-associated protease RseP (regulator of RpoE activity)
MSFVVYDIFLLGLFVVAIAGFLYFKRENLKKEGLLFLYKEKWGIKLINYVGNKYQRTLKVFSYLSIGIGYVLMVTMLYLFGRLVWIYAFHREIVSAIKVPPIMPLIPYLPKLFNLDFLPPFYFTYWIIILAVIAITHEFSHGIFAAYNKIKIKTTGFGFFPFFFPVFLAAFVELDEKKMSKKKKFAQMSILSAGTFANILTALFFLGILWVFFSLAFTPSGVVFDNYAYSAVGIAGISSVNGIHIENPTLEKIITLANKTGLNQIEADGEDYVITKEFLEKQSENEIILLYDNAPAINAGLMGAIIEIDGVKISDIDILSDELSKKSPGEKISVNAKLGDEISHEYEIVLDKSPIDENRAWLGIVFVEQGSQGFMGKIISTFSSFKKPHIYYEPKIDGFSWFIYNLLWWMVLISFSVALVNMLPMGIFDGGRFFYLTVLGITKDEKKAQKAFKFMTQFLLFLLFLIMVFWAFSFF